MKSDTPATGDRAGGLWASHTAGARHHPPTSLEGSTVQDRTDSLTSTGGRRSIFIGAT